MFGGERLGGGGPVFHLFPGEEALHFPRMGSEEAWSLCLVEVLQSGMGNDGQRIGIDYRGNGRLPDDSQGSCRGSRSKPRPDSDGIGGEIEDIGQMLKGADHDLRNDGAGEEFVGVR